MLSYNRPGHTEERRHRCRLNDATARDLTSGNGVSFFQPLNFQELEIALDPATSQPPIARTPSPPGMLAVVVAGHTNIHVRTWPNLPQPNRMSIWSTKSIQGPPSGENVGANRAAPR